MRRSTVHPESRREHAEREDERGPDAVTRRRAAALKHAREVLQRIRESESERGTADPRSARGRPADRTPQQR